MRGAIAKKSTAEGEWRPAFKDRDGAWTIQLNRDPDTGGRTLAVRYTKGWEVAESLHDGTAEVLVLEGVSSRSDRSSTDPATTSASPAASRTVLSGRSPMSGYW